MLQLGHDNYLLLQAIEVCQLRPYLQGASTHMWTGVDMSGTAEACAVSLLLRNELTQGDSALQKLMPPHGVGP